MKKRVKNWLSKAKKYIKKNKSNIQTFAVFGLIAVATILLSNYSNSSKQFQGYFGLPGETPLVYLVSPTNGANNVELKPNLSWTNVPEFSGFLYLLISEDDIFPESETEYVLMDRFEQNHTVLNNLQENTTYYWTLVAANTAGSSRLSPTYFFNTRSATEAEPTPTPTPTPDNAQLISPSYGNNNVSIYPTFSWESLANRESYLLQIATDSSFSNVVRDRSGSSTSYAFAEPLNNSTTYYWRIRAAKNDGTTYTYPYNVFTTVASTIVTPPPITTTTGNVQVNFSGSRTTTTEGNKNINVTVTLSSALSFDLDVPVTLRSSSTAINGTDFTLPSSEFIRFNRGETSRTYTVRLDDDNTRELDKTIILRLNSFNFPSNVSIGSNNTYTITIEDNDGGLTRTPINTGMAVSCEKYFIDVDRYDSLCTQLEYLYVNGIFRGQNTPSGNRASLNNELKRSEYFAIASRLLGRENMRVGSLSNLLSRFRDLTPQVVNNRDNAWWLTATSQLEGYVRGYGPEGQKTLEAGRVTTEAEIAKVALEGKFRDFTNRDYISPWYSDTQAYMSQYGFYIDPTRNATRADAVELLYVILQVEKDRNFYRNFAY